MQEKPVHSVLPKEKKPTPPPDRFTSILAIAVGTIWFLGGILFGLFLDMYVIGKIFYVAGYEVLGIAMLRFGIKRYLQAGGTWQNILRGYAKTAVTLSSLFMFVTVGAYLEREMETLWPDTLIYAVIIICGLLVLYLVKKPDEKKQNEK